MAKKSYAKSNLSGQTETKVRNAMLTVHTWCAAGVRPVFVFVSVSVIITKLFVSVFG